MAYKCENALPFCIFMPLERLGTIPWNGPSGDRWPRWLA